ncbi:hypothetical protein COCSUDRAFT_83537 [Coccomyxa subellipsoidea C-169]|uniref:Uncharacterized protein n=1 Tax=Coccomyxa subellipsoidea (strain C-169) TaxID=574566 RepID=I0YRF9_COCSC|nr:hypothetical protein COCSUDRAFT_83537 [Coccomyxa subellipsoidea C-169]EIE20978.1 hypothetical protein COCSUDRAFT_83537 [Coccomyxa subellipsoidea C-169]|eukprot:XP_005645522.1 hypothetical protein COCSUDRAFT_83537 [Coccomyxa subellipsoidea C-169]
MCLTGVQYVDSIREALVRSLVLVDSPCQHIDGYNKPEIELQNSKELLLDPIELRRNEQECIVIERSLNSVRVNVQLKRVGDLEAWLRSKRIAFIMQRADYIDIIRRKPAPGFDISFLVTARHLQSFDKTALINLITTLVTELASVNDLKRLISSRGRVYSLSISRALAA